MDEKKESAIIHSRQSKRTWRIFNGASAEEWPDMYEVTANLT